MLLILTDQVMYMCSLFLSVKQGESKHHAIIGCQFLQETGMGQDSKVTKNLGAVLHICVLHFYQ